MKRGIKLIPVMLNFSDYFKISIESDGNKASMKLVEDLSEMTEEEVNLTMTMIEQQYGVTPRVDGNLVIIEIDEDEPDVLAGAISELCGRFSFYDRYEEYMELMKMFYGEKIKSLYQEGK